MNKKFVYEEESFEIICEAKECPFCGATELTLTRASRIGSPDRWCIRCKQCGANTGYKTEYYAPDKAVDAWNRRTIEPEQYKRLLRCNHECKIDCLLKEYERVKDERDKARSEKAFLIDRIKSLIRSTMVGERDMNL